MIIRNFYCRLVPITSLFYALTAPVCQASTGSAEIISSVNNYMTEYLADLSLNSNSSGSTRTVFNVAHLDSRLALPDCKTPLQIEEKNRSTNNNSLSLNVRCEGVKPWSIYVPVTINSFQSIVAANGPLAKGTLITNAHLQMKEINVRQLRGEYFTDMSAITGKQAKRPIRPNSAILASYLQAPIVIKRGDSVLVLAKSGSLVVRVSGTAMNDGRQGEQIRIKNTKSKRIVDARIIGPGQVEVAL